MNGTYVIRGVLVLGLLGAGFSGAMGETGIGDSNIFSIEVNGVSATPEDQPVLHSCIERVYPNPFNPVVNIEFRLPQAMPVEMGVYDLRGLLVRRLVAGEVQPAGLNLVRWDGRNATGGMQAAGVYLCRLKAADGIHHQRLTLVK